MTAAKKIDFGWRHGFPPGKYYPGMERDFEVCFAPGGVKWHRKRTPEQIAEYDRRTITLAEK